MSQKKVGDKLSHISKSGLSHPLLKEMYMDGTTLTVFNNNPTGGINDPNNGFLNSGKFLSSRGVLPYYRPDGTQFFLLMRDFLDAA